MMTLNDLEVKVFFVILGATHITRVRIRVRHCAGSRIRVPANTCVLRFGHVTWAVFNIHRADLVIFLLNRNATRKSALNLYSCEA